MAKFGKFEVVFMFPDEYSDMISNQENDVRWEFDFKDFEGTISYAKQRLWDLEECSED